MLLREWIPRGEPEQRYMQLVLPKKHRQKVMEMAHSMPLAGHLGSKKTIDRIIRRFYWPGMFKEVKDYCQQCPECQKVSNHGRHRAPLI